MSKIDKKFLEERDREHRSHSTEEANIADMLIIDPLSLELRSTELLVFKQYVMAAPEYGYNFSHSPA